MICNLCPRQCGADRSTALGLKRSICHASDDIEVALVSLHAWEEPILEAKKGPAQFSFLTAIYVVVFAKIMKSVRKAKASGYRQNV